MTPSVEKTEQITIILPERVPYRPLGVKIRKLEYRFPEGYDLETVRFYLEEMREAARDGHFTNVPHFHDDLNLSTANLESFKNLSPLLWSQFKDTVFFIVNKLLDHGGEGRKKAYDLLRPLAYEEIPEDPDHVWGYASQMVDYLRFPSPFPSRCAWRYIDENAVHLLAELHRDLIESFERRNNLHDSRPAHNQCYEPYQPMRYHLETGLEGPDEVAEGIEFLNPGLFSEGSQTVAFRVTVTDSPRGKKTPSPKQAQATYRATFEGLPRPPTPTPESAAQDPKRRGLVELAKRTKGRPKIAKDKDTLLRRIEEAAVPEKTVDFIDCVIVIDASGSMGDNIEEVKRRVPQLLEEMRKKVKSQSLSDVRIAIVSYTDNENVRHLGLTSANPDRLRQKLGEVIKRTRTAMGFLETVWDALYITIDREPWRRGQNGFRRLVYLTDARGDPGRLGKTQADVDRIA